MIKEIIRWLFMMATVMCYILSAPDEATKWVYYAYTAIPILIMLGIIYFTELKNKIFK